MTNDIAKARAALDEKKRKATDRVDRELYESLSAALENLGNRVAALENQLKKK